MKSTRDKPKILIVDDEPLARLRVAALVEEIAAGEVVGEAGNGEEALMAVADKQPDIVLMDIRMPGLDGLQAAAQFDQFAQPPAVIFTTAYGDHALEAFDAHAVDYLLKPINKQRLLEAITRAHRVTRSIIQKLRDDQAQARSHISAMFQGEIRKIPLQEIILFRADQKYTSVITLGQEFLIEDTLKSLEAEFHDDFLRIHRNSLVAKHAIIALQKQADSYVLRLNGHEEPLPVSRRCLASVKTFLLY